MSRGRPNESEAIPLDQWTMECYEYPNKPELGYKAVYYFDRNKSPNGCWRVDHTPAKGEVHPKIKADKGKAYNKQPVVMVFKTSNNSNARVKMKIWANENIDYIATQTKLPGVPDKAVILELGVGESFINIWKSKYKL